MIRLAQKNDLPEIMEIYAVARNYMRNTGNKNQWINGYPSEQLLCDDIKNENLYVTEAGGVIYAVFAFIIGKDSTYSYIEGGSWLNQKDYGTIHRIASNGSKKGVMQECVNFCWKKIQNLRADTHADNKTMQHCLEKCGFKYCGVIYVEDGSPRVAYQRE